MKPQFKLLFFLYRAKTNSSGTAPIYCRITLQGKRKQFSTGFFISPENWNSNTRAVIDTAPNAQEINNYLTAIKGKVLNLSLKHQLEDEDFTLDTLYNELLGKSLQKIKTFLQVFKKHNDEMYKLVGKTYSIATYKKFEGFYKQLKEFIRIKYNKDDILLSNVKIKFLLDLEHYLLTEKNMKQVSINKTIQRVKKIIKYAFAHEYIDKDPLMLHKAKSVITQVVFLEKDELFLLENHELSSERLTRIKDSFIFCCYTGLAYTEMSKLARKHIVKGVDRKDWIKIQRQKTLKPLMIPLLPRAIAILNQYNNKDYNDIPSDKLLLPSITNQKFNKYLKEVATEVGIRKKLTHHVARKTFASTVLLYHDIPMEVVSELLGHSSLAITQQYYGKVINKKLGQQMTDLGERLKGDG